MSGSNPYPWRQGRNQPQIDVSNQSNQPHQMGQQQQHALETGGFYVAKQPTLKYTANPSAKPITEVGHSYLPEKHYIPPVQHQEYGSHYGPQSSQENTPFPAPPRKKNENPYQRERNLELGTSYIAKPTTQPPQRTQDVGSYYPSRPAYSGPDYQPPPQPQQQQYQPQYQQAQPSTQKQTSGRTITQISLGQLSSPQQTPAQPNFPKQQPEQYQPQQYQPQSQQYQPPQQQYQPQPQQYQPQPQQYQPQPQQYQPQPQQYQPQPQQYQPQPQQYQPQPQQYQPQPQQYQPQPQQYQSNPPNQQRALDAALPHHLRQGAPQVQEAAPVHQPYQQNISAVSHRRRGKFQGSKKVFSPEQIARYRRVFDAFDSNKNGVLEANELFSVARELGYRLPREQMDDVLKSFDLDPYSILTFDEFLEAMPGNVDLIPEDEHRRAEIRHKFQEFDRDCNGYISREEAYSVLYKELGFDREKSNSLINQFDINSDGHLSYEEFIGFYMKVRERKDAIDTAFRQFDRDNKGYVSMADAKRILRGQLFTDSEVERIVKTHDKNNDGVLQYEEFVHFWTA